MKRLSFALLTILLILPGCELIEDVIDGIYVSPISSTDDETVIVTEEATCVGAYTATLNGTLKEYVSEDTPILFYFSTTPYTAEQMLQRGFCETGQRNGMKTSLSMDDLIFQKKYYYVAAVNLNGVKICGNVKTFTTQLSATTAVDMGLSVKWARCNVGATKPEEPGGFYQWAGTKDVTSTSTKLDYTYCPYHSGKDSKSGWIKYVGSSYSSYWSGQGNPDNKSTLESADDIAHVKLGGNWRMPTFSEWMELYDNCTITWTTVNGHSGCIFTSNKPGYTGSCIFIPAAGRRDGKDLIDVGVEGSYWASTKADYDDRPNLASLVTFKSWTKGTGTLPRYLGQTVRPVQKK